MHSDRSDASVMDAKSRFWLFLILGLAGLFVTLVISCVYLNQKTSTSVFEAVERLVHQGHDPIAARCAIRGRSSENDITCILKAAQQKPASVAQP